ncbi:Bacitracin export permease protein BceB [Neobacillus rhizosphaerae]|uniref:Bacitracin export permease protein BceB n=1 Tax=Neobacillus rhizosphaerae TaxID=2880965 RepID=A0ABN8KWB0_9BACI|nr:ABC transporter permease [Neobacillus rhizosphaerae]CAH2716840.1 Bacitracin export permease protein BceB [Neobacillus rhizosphaerae]
MTLYNIVFKNIKHNFSQYILYIASMTFSVMIYFTFVSLQYNDQITAALPESEKFESAFLGSSFVLLLFVAIFISYSNSFFMKRRKKEIGLYSLFGVSRKKIGKMLFCENFIMGILSLLIGILVGELFSVFFTMILIKLMGFSIVVKFSLSTYAVLQTVILFLIINSLTSLQGYFIMYRFKLIELFHAERKGEKPFKPSFIIAILALMLIGISYWLLLNAYESKSWNEHFGRNLLITLVMIVAGSYFLFHSLSGFFLKMLQNNKRFYYKWSNLLTMTQLTNRLKTNAVMLTMISVLNAVTLIAYGFAFSMYYNSLATIKDFTPYSYQYTVTGTEVDDRINRIIINNQEHPVLFSKKWDYLLMKADATNLPKLPGSYYYFDEKVALIPLKTYNQLVEELNKPKIASLKATEAVSIVKNFIGSQNDNENVNKRILLTSPTDDQSVKVVDTKSLSLLNGDVQPFLIVIQDQLYEKLAKENERKTVQVFKIKQEETSTELTNKIKDVLPAETEFSSFSANYEEIQSTYGLVIFISGFLGLVFLAATGSIIYFKMLTEATEDRTRYLVLRKIGINKREVRKVISKQFSIVFILPLILGIAHSSIILTALSKIMDINFLIPVMICTGTYTLLYGSYYVFTVISGSKIVNQ